MNKVVCFVEENRFKGQRTPIDAFGKSEQRWNQITQAITKWVKKDRRLAAKKDKFFMTAADVQKRDFLSSQLNDTRYIGKLALEYLQTLGVEITASKGATTAWVRHQWYLNSLLSESSEKERTDHRHHALDAAVIACVNRRFYNALVKTAKQLEQQKSQLEMRDLVIDPPWPNLRADLQTALDQIIVSHTPQRKLNGELHEITGAGFISVKHGKIEFTGNVHRKTLDGDFTQLDKIIDPTLKRLVERHLARFQNNPKQAFNPDNPVYHLDGKTPINRVRIAQSKTTKDKLAKTKFPVYDRQGQVFKWLTYGNLHHVEIVRDRVNGCYQGIFVTMMEACRRARGIGMEKQAIIQADHGNDKELVMALHINDLVIANHDGIEKIYRVQKLESDSSRVTLRLHTAATLSRKEEEIRFTINKVSFEKYAFKRLQVNAIGKRRHD
jgi:CRISPR-associated endonuclease Csn1